MRIIAFLTILIAGWFGVSAQNVVSIQTVESGGAKDGLQADKEMLEGHLKFLASDELQGRRTTSEGCQKAAQYISDQFLKYGVQVVEGHESLFQPIPFDVINPPRKAEFKMGGSEYKLGDNLLMLNGLSYNGKTTAVFANHGWVDASAGVDDYKGLDVKGKIVMVLPGSPGSKNPFEIFEAIDKKRRMAAERGAAGLIELFRMNFPWQFFTGYFNKERIEVVWDENDSGVMLYGWLKEGTPNPVTDLENGKELPIEVSTDGVRAERKWSSNIVGVIQGTDKALRNEYVLLSAHYDHVGIGKEGGAAYTPEDSIFNGARDNAMGVVALLAAAESLAKNPPKRSIVLLACTAEEMGMLGSAYYAEKPFIPLAQTVFNFNNDGAGYNSTEHVTVIGKGRTNVDDLLDEGAKEFGLAVLGDPAPEQQLYDRSDNVSFAKKGIPAIDYSPGMTAMDEAIFKYYHQAADNADSIDYDYLMRFCQAYTQTARLLADSPVKPAWTKGDKYEKK